MGGPTTRVTAGPGEDRQRGRAGGGGPAGDGDWTTKGRRRRLDDEGGGGHSGRLGPLGVRWSPAGNKGGHKPCGITPQRDRGAAEGPTT